MANYKGFFMNPEEVSFSSATKNSLNSKLRYWRDKGLDVSNNYTVRDLALQDYAFEQSQSSANKQMEFQEYMSSTAHQREVKDLIASGLNPVLSANGGAAMASGSSASMTDNATAAKTARMNQSAANRTQIKMNNASLQNAYKIAKLQARTSLEASKYAADVSAAATMSAAGTSAYASMYGADMSYKASKYGVDNPNNPIAYGIKSVFGDTNAGKKIFKKGKKTSKLLGETHKMK